MSDSDVLYSDVKFTQGSGKTNGTTSSSTETTYSEVRIKTQPSAELPGSHQHVVSNERSKVPSERLALVVVSVLLAAAAIALGLTLYRNTQIMERLQKVTDELVAVQNNVTAEKHCGVKSCNSTVQCPQPPQVKNDSCPACEEGWERHGGKCYYFSIIKAVWEDSRQECIAKGGDLVKIDSREEQSFLLQKLREKKPLDLFWIGLTDVKEEGKWLWVDDSPLIASLTFWTRNLEPDNWTGENPDGEDCVRMGNTGGQIHCWFDKSCKASQRSICEKPEKN